MSDRIAVMSGGHIVQAGTPREIFEQPADEFVVDFVGETNPFECRLVEFRRSTAVVRTKEGLLFEVMGYSDAVAAMPPGGQLTLYFREEQVRLSTDSSGPNCLPGSVVEAHYLGTMLNYVVMLAGSRSIRAAIPNVRANAFPVGQQLFALVDPADCVLVPK